MDLTTQITATFAAGAVPAGTYSVRVTGAGGSSAQLPGAFTVVAGGQPLLKTSITAPSVLGYHHVSTYYVEYSN